MPQRKFSIPINGNDFEFDWDKESDPTQDEIITLYKSKNKKPDSLWKKIQTPLTTAPAEVGKAVSKSYTDPSRIGTNYLDPNTALGKAETFGRNNLARVRGAIGGAMEGVGNFATQMTTPLDIAANVTGLGAVRRASSIPLKVASALTAARGGQNIYEGAKEGDLGKVGAGSLEAALSLLGVRAQTPGKRVLGENLRQVDALPPESVPARVPVTSKNTTINPAITKAAVALQDPIRRPMAEINPNKVTRPLDNTIKPDIGMRPVESIAKPDISNVSPTIQKAVSHKDPAIAKAAQEVVAANAKPVPIDKKSTSTLQNAKRIAEEWLYKPMVSVIKDDSEAGSKIGRMMEKAYADYSTWAGQTSNRISKATEGLSAAEKTNLPRAIQGKEVPLSSKVQAAMKEFSTIDEEFMKRATDAGLKMRAGDKTVPFTKQDNYWARIYPDEFIKSRQGDIYNEMIAKGMAPDEATKALENSRMFGNRLIDPQHGRVADVEGYRLDIDSQKHHYNDLAQRIVEAETFGNMDTADVNSPLSKEIAKTNDKQRVKELVDQYLGRTGGGKGYVQDVANKINKFQVAVQLPLFAIKNQSQKAMIPIKGNISEFAKALTQYTTKEGKAIAENTGALQSIRDIIYEMGGESKISKYYGITKTEEGNRGLAAITGKGTAARLFSELKANPSDKIARSKLDELLLEDVDTVLKQDSLTDAQSNRAGFRMAELTQGSANPMNLPSKWSEHPETKILTLYKRFALQQSKLIKDSIMQDWKKNLPTALAALTIAGEVVGDTYTGVKSTLQGQDPTKEIAARGSDNFVNDMMTKITGDKDAGFLAGRVAKDLSDSMALGIMQDFIETAGGGTRSLVHLLVGPTIGNMDKLVTSIGSAAKEGSVRPVAKEVARQVVPVPFNTPASNLFGKDREKKRSMYP